MMLCFLPMMLLCVMADILWVRVSIYYKVGTLELKGKQNVWFYVFVPNIILSHFVIDSMTTTKNTNLYNSQQYNTCYQGNQSSHPVPTLKVNQLPVTELLTNGVC